MRRAFFGRRGELLGRQLLLRVHVPQPELDPHLAAFDESLAGDQRLGLDLPPVGEARLLFEVGDLLDEGWRGRAARNSPSGRDCW